MTHGTFVEVYILDEDLRRGLGLEPGLGRGLGRGLGLGLGLGRGCRRGLGLGLGLGRSLGHDLSLGRGLGRHFDFFFLGSLFDRTLLSLKQNHEYIFAPKRLRVKL